MFPCYASNTPSKVTCGYHNCKLIITPTEEIKIYNAWKISEGAGVRFAAKTPGCDDVMKQANF
jgi:hypothetical protein